MRVVVQPLGSRCFDFDAGFEAEACLEGEGRERNEVVSMAGRASTMEGERARRRTAGVGRRVGDSTTPIRKEARDEGGAAAAAKASGAGLMVRSGCGVQVGVLASVKDARRRR